MKDAMERLDAARTPFLDATPPGPNGCQFCGGGHQPDMPHNQHAAFYQAEFQKRHGRLPTWADAIAHCSESVRKAWMTALKEQDAWSEPEPNVPVVMHLGDIELTPQGEAEVKDIRITELEVYVDVLETALQPFAAEGAKWHESFGDDERPYCLLATMNPTGDTLATFTLGDLRRAAKLLKGRSDRTVAEIARLRAVETAALAIFQHPHGSAEELDAMAALNALLQKDVFNESR